MAPKRKNAGPARGRKGASENRRLTADKRVRAKRGYKTAYRGGNQPPKTAAERNKAYNLYESSAIRSYPANRGQVKRRKRAK